MALALLLHAHPQWRHHVRLSRPGARVLGELLAIGVPVSVTVIVEATLFLATGLMVGQMGATVLAAHTVALSTASVTFMVPMAIAGAANVRVAHEMGAGRLAEARRAGLVAIGMSAAFMGGTALLFVTEPRMIARLYLGAGSPTLAMAGSLLGTSTTTSYIESAAGVSAGGRTGLTAVVVAILFLLALFFSPLAASVPAFATAPALLFVAVLMCSGLAEINWMTSPKPHRWWSPPWPCRSPTRSPTASLSASSPGPPSSCFRAATVS